MNPCIEVRTHAEATVEVHRQLIRNFGSDPDILDELRTQVMPCPHEGSDRKGTVIAVYPRKEGADSARAIFVYFGDPVPANRGRG